MDFEKTGSTGSDTQLLRNLVALALFFLSLKQGDKNTRLVRFFEDEYVEILVQHIAHSRNSIKAMSSPNSCPFPPTLSPK